MTHSLGSVYERDDGQAAAGAVSHLVMSADDTDALNTIYHFLRQYEPSQPIPEAVRKLYLEHQLKLAQEKMGRDLCRDLKTAGKCRNKRICHSRHFLHPGSDRSPASVPTGAEVRFDLVRMKSPVHFVGKFRAIKHVAGDVVDWNGKGLTLKLALLTEKSLQRVSSGFIVGRTYLARGPNLSFKRAELLSAEDTSFDLDESEGSSVGKNRFQRFEIELLFVDEGRIEKGINLDLWMLPDELSESKFPRGSCEVVVVGLLPKGNP